MLHIKNLIAKYPGNSSPALQIDNFSAKEGEIIAVLGANGSGKSTLFRAINREIENVSGEIIIQSKKNYRTSKCIRNVTQDVNEGVISGLTILENMVLSADDQCLFYSSKAKKYRKMIAELSPELEDFIERNVDQLSGGQRQKIALLLALLKKPKLLLLDEHTSALDPNSSKNLMEYTYKILKGEKLTTLMITHSMSDALRYSDRIIVINNGRIVHDMCNKTHKITSEELLKLLTYTES